MSASSGLRSLGKAALRRAFELGQRVGVDVLPRHFYSEIPDLPSLRRDTTWLEPRSLAGISGASVDAQLAFVASCLTHDVRGALARTRVHDEACRANGAAGYGPIESDFLYAFTRTHRPPRVIQIGAGVATSVMLQGARDAGYTLELTAVDPYPTRFLRALEAGGAIRLHDAPAQGLPATTFESLKAGDLLFIDSTHTVKPGSEVNRIVLDVLPKLVPGVFVHFHDITFPYDYPRALLTDTLFFWNESVLVQAFLACNDRYRICAALSMLHYAARDRLAEYLPRYRPAPDRFGLDVGRRPAGTHFPSALYLEARPSAGSDPGGRVWAAEFQAELRS